MATATSSVADICRAAKRAAPTLAQTPTQTKDGAHMLVKDTEIGRGVLPHSRGPIA